MNFCSLKGSKEVYKSYEIREFFFFFSNFCNSHHSPHTYYWVRGSLWKMWVHVAGLT